jgi:hypothetical protein
MRFHLFFCGAAIIALGFMAYRALEVEIGYGFLTGALTLGGGILICGLFSLRMPLHGLAGAGVLALLGAGRGLANLVELPRYWLGERSRGTAPLLESAVAIICILLLLHVVRALKIERSRRMLLQDEANDPPAAS